jgi:hypothetical protein
MVRVKREIDPGVQKALTLIEEFESDGNPLAKSAREMLLTFHHLRQKLELVEFGACEADLTNADRRLVDALLAARWQAQSFKGGVYVDLFDFCDRIEAVLDKNTLLTQVKNAIRSNPSDPADPKDMVQFSDTTGAEFQHAHGLSIYFPVRAADYTPKYMNLELSKDTGWGRLVRAYLEATRRLRRDEASHWSSTEYLRRFSTGETDPLHSEDIEARIVGVAPKKILDELPSTGKAGTTDSARAGTTDSARAGTTDSARAGTTDSARAGTTDSARAGTTDSARAGTTDSARAGTTDSARAGTTDSARAGTTDSARGKRVNVVFGNPPDGFYRKDS